jgi:hypothetical protein
MCCALVSASPFPPSTPQVVLSAARAARIPEMERGNTTAIGLKDTSYLVGVMGENYSLTSCQRERAQQLTCWRDCLR